MAKREREMATLIGIPDDLLQKIVDKIFDVKSLLMVYLVSRRFARIVRNVPKVCISLRCFQRDSGALTARIRNLSVRVDERLLESVICGVVRPYTIPPFMGLPNCLPPVSRFLSVLRFVSRLGGIRHLTIEVPSFIDHTNQLIFKWAIHMGDGVIQSVSAMQKDLNLGQIPWEAVAKDAALRLDLLVQQSPHHPQLQSFTMIDPRGRGPTTVLTGEDLDRFKVGQYNPRWLRNIKVVQASVPQLVVPSFGELMPEAQIVLQKFVYTGDQVEVGTQVSERDMEEFVSCFDQMDQRESIFQEAAEEIQKFHRVRFESNFILRVGSTYFFR